MRDDDFRLQWCEWRGSGVDPKPQTFASANVGDGERRYALKVRAERVFFRADEPRNAPIFSLTKRAPESLESDNVELRAFFAREVTAGRWGRFFTVRRGFTLESGYGMGKTVLLAIIGADGHNFAREWCDGEWLPFQLLPASPPTSSAHVPPLWSAAWKPFSLRTSLSGLTEPLATRPFSPKPPLLSTEVWLRGDEIELRTLLEAVLTFCSIPSHYLQYGYRWTPYAIYWAETPLEKSCITLSLPLPGSSGLLRVLCREFVMLGGQWRSFGERRCRKDWRFERKQWSTSSNPHSRSNSPRIVTAHEKLEALMLLRDWLVPRVGDAETQRLLAFAR